MVANEMKGPDRKATIFPPSPPPPSSFRGDGNGIRCSTKRFVDVGSFHRRCRSLRRKYGRVWWSIVAIFIGEHGVFFGRGEAWRALLAEERNHFCYMLGVKSCLGTLSFYEIFAVFIFCFFIVYETRFDGEG